MYLSIIIIKQLPIPFQHFRKVPLRCFHTTLESSVNIVKTTGSNIYHVRKFLFRAFLSDSENLNQNILCRSVSCCHPNTLFVDPSAHSAESCSCSNHMISQNMEKHLSIQQNIFEERSKSIIDQVFTLGFT